MLRKPVNNGTGLHLQVIWKRRLEAKILKSNKQSIREKTKHISDSLTANIKWICGML